MYILVSAIIFAIGIFIPKYLDLGLILRVLLIILPLLILLSGLYKTLNKEEKK